jgi:hypothetical protein
MLSQPLLTSTPNRLLRNAALAVHLLLGAANDDSIAVVAGVASVGRSDFLSENQGGSKST